MDFRVSFSDYGSWYDIGLYVDYCKKQYFDLQYLPINYEGEIFVDAGCYNGYSTLCAAEWASENGSYLKRAYAFEADKKNISVCKKNN